MLLERKRNRLSENAIGSSVLSVLEPKIMLAADIPDFVTSTGFGSRDVGVYSVNNNAWGLTAFIEENEEKPANKISKGNKNGGKTAFKSSDLKKLSSTVKTAGTYSDGLKTARFTINNNGLSTTSNRPLGFPAVYRGKVDSRTNVAAYNFTGVSQDKLKSAKFVLKYKNDKSKGGVHNVAIDVWLGGNTNQPAEYLMVQSFNTNAQKGKKTGTGQPAGSRKGTTTIDGIKYDIWHGKNHQKKNVTTYVAQSAKSTLTGDLKDFIKHAEKAKYISKKNPVNAVFGGAEVWSGADGLNIEFGVDFKRNTTPPKKSRK